MKIGPLVFQDYAAKKPVTLDKAQKYVTAQQIVTRHSLARNLPTKLPRDQQVQLTLDRLALEPEFKFGNLNGDTYTKDEVIKHVKEQTELGQAVVQAEMAHCKDLIAGVLADKRPPRVVMPHKRLVRAPDMRLIKRCMWIRLRTRAVFAECTTDDVTQPFANWRIAHVHPVFAGRGFTVVALTGADDVRAKFVPEATHALTVYLSGVGHGNYDHYTGHRPAPGAPRDIILQVGAYAPEEVKNRSIHLLSCRTGRDLGPDTVAHGARSFGGYTEDFNLVWDEGGASRWELFAQADATWDLFMANGNTAQDAYNATIAAFNAAIATVPGTYTATVLTWDRDHLKLSGSPTAVISPYRWVRVCFPLVNIALEKALIEAGKLYDKLPVK